MTQLRIAYFGSSTAIDGGSELCLLRMARHFHGIHRVTLFLPDDGPLFQAASGEGIECVNLRFLRLRKHRGMDWLRWGKSVLHARRQLKRECLEREIELLHFNDFIDLPFYAVPKKGGIPAVTHLRLIVQSPAVKKFYRRAVGRGGCTVIPVSQAVSRKMLESDPTIEATIIHDPAPDQTIFFPASEPHDDKPHRLVMVSKLLENKGHLNFLKVAKRVEEQTPGKFSFTLVAPPSPGREEYEKKVREKFSELPSERSDWIPGTDHKTLGEILRASSLLLHLPDTEDSFPGVVLEAMACGTPVLAYRRGGIPEQLNEGEAGILVEPGDINGAVEKVHRLFDDEGHRRSLCQRGLEKIQRDFSADGHFERLDALYREILGLG